MALNIHPHLALRPSGRLKQLFFSEKNSKNIIMHCNFLNVWNQTSLVAWVVASKNDGRKPRGKKNISIINTSENGQSKFVFFN